MCGSSAPSGPSTSTTQTSNIPEYARPYVETMLGATQKQLFDTKQNVDPTTGQTSTEITGMKGYTPYSTDMNQYFAGASPMQEQSYRGAANLGPAQQTMDASNIAAQAALEVLCFSGPCLSPTIRAHIESWGTELPRHTQLV